MDNNIQLFRLFLSNQFKEGGKKNKGHSRPSYNELTFLLDYNTAWKGTRYDTPEWRTFWTKLAKRESSFNPLVMNSIGAKGYFLLMPYNRSSTWQNNTLLFAEADKLIRSMEAKITADDLRRAEALGLNKLALLAGAWLGGIGGMRAALRGQTRADKNGTTVMSRMKDFNNLIILPLIDPVEQYLNTPIGSHIIDNPIYATGDLYSSQAPITARVDSNTSVLEVEPFVIDLPEVVVTASAPLKKAIALLLLDYGLQNQPEVASILVLNNNVPTITDKVAALSLADTDKMALNIEDAIIRQNIELNFANSLFTHFFDEDLAAKQRDLIQDLRFRRAINNTAAYGGDISGNMFETGGPFSWGMPAMPGLIIAQKLRKLFSSEPQKRPQRNVRTDRKQDNLSKATAQRSQAIENKIYSMLPKQRTPYDIQFIPDKQILINGYNTSTNALDSLAKYAGIHNRTLLVSEMPIRAKSKTKTRPVTKEEALGLSLRETKGGALPYTNDSRTSGDKEAKRAFYNANVFTAFLDIPATALVNDYHYNKTSQTVPPLLDAFQYYAQGDYNRGDPNHTADVKAAGAEAFKNPQVQDWWNNEGKYWFNGTYLNAGDDTRNKKALGGNLFYDGGYEDDEDDSGEISLGEVTVIPKKQKLEIPKTTISYPKYPEVNPYVADDAYEKKKIDSWFGTKKGYNFFDKLFKTEKYRKRRDLYNDVYSMWDNFNIYGKDELGNITENIGQAKSIAELQEIPEKERAKYFRKNYTPLLNEGIKASDYVSSFYKSKGYAARPDYSNYLREPWTLDNKTSIAPVLQGEGYLDSATYDKQHNQITVGIPSMLENHTMTDYNNWMYNLPAVMAHETGHFYDSLAGSNWDYEEDAYSKQSGLPDYYSTLFSNPLQTYNTDYLMLQAKRKAEELYEYMASEYGYDSYDDYKRAEYAELGITPPTRSMYTDEEWNDLQVLYNEGRKNWEAAKASIADKDTYINNLALSNLQDRLKELKLHDFNPHENYADLQALRYLLYKEGIYDARKVDKYNKTLDITPEMWEKFKNTQSYNASRLALMYDFDKIQEMNYTIRANGGPLFNSRTPIESFQGGKHLPTVRY